MSSPQEQPKERKRRPSKAKEPFVEGRDYASIPYLDEVCLRRRLARPLYAYYVLKYKYVNKGGWVQEEDFYTICKAHFYKASADNNCLSRRTIKAKVLEPGDGIFWDKFEQPQGNAYRLRGPAKVAQGINKRWPQENIRFFTSSVVRRIDEDLPTGVTLAFIRSVFTRNAAERDSGHPRSVASIGKAVRACERTIYARFKQAPEIYKQENWVEVRRFKFDQRDEANNLCKFLNAQAQENGGGHHRVFICHHGDGYRWENDPTYERPDFVVARRRPNSFLPTSKRRSTAARRANRQLNRTDSGSHEKTQPLNVSARLYRITGERPPELGIEPVATFKRGDRRAKNRRHLPRSGIIWRSHGHGHTPEGQVESAVERAKDPSTIRRLRSLLTRSVRLSTFPS